MSIVKNKTLIRRYYDELWNQWKFVIAHEILASEIRFRGSLGIEVQGIEGFKGYMRTIRTAFPDFHNGIEQLIAEENHVVARLTYRGTQKGEVFGIAPTSRRIAYAGVAIFWIKNGRIEEGWVLGDTMSLKRQLEETRP